MLFNTQRVPQISRSRIINDFPELDFANIQTVSDWKLATREDAESMYDIYQYYTNCKWNELERLINLSDVNCPNDRLEILAFLYRNMPYFKLHCSEILEVVDIFSWLNDMLTIHRELCSFVDTYGEDFRNCVQTHGIAINLDMFVDDLDALEKTLRYQDIRNGNDCYYDEIFV